MSFDSIEPARPRSGAFPLSFAQQRLWFLSQIPGLCDAYRMRIVLSLRGKLDRTALRCALNRILVRHEALRTTFVVEDGEPVQQILSAQSSRFYLEEHDVRTKDAGRVDQLIAQGMGESFDLLHGPLIRGHLLRHAEDEHTLLITMHHIVSDGWSLGLLSDELTALYTAFVSGNADPLPELPVQYADYAVWQRRWVEGEIRHNQAEYWKSALAGAPVLLQLPADRIRSPQPDYKGDVVSLVLDEKMTFDLRQLSKRHRTTLYMTLLAGWTALLGRLSGQQDIVVGTPVANRGRIEIEKLIGVFVNTLALRFDLSGCPSTAELLDRVKAQTIAAQRHQDIPFEQVVEVTMPARSLAYNPLFQSMFAWDNIRNRTVQLPGVEVQNVEISSHVMARCDVTLSLQAVGERIVGGLIFATALFERATIERYAGYFRMFLQGMVEEENTAVDSLSLLTEAERVHSVYTSASPLSESLRDYCIHALFEKQVKSTPDAIAVVFDEASLSYGELNRRANRLAHYLVATGLRPDQRVGICVEHGFGIITGLLAVLKGGGAYVPLDQNVPPGRLRYMVENSKASLILTQKHLEGHLEAIRGDVPLVVLDSIEGEFACEHQPDSNLDVEAIGLKPGHLAYVIYTSGSTGEPKGVMVEHKSVVNLLIWSQRRYQLSCDDAVLQETSCGFDAAISECFRPLVAGARLVLPRPGGHRDPAYVVEAIQRNLITNIGFAPTMLSAFLDYANSANCLSLTHVISGGEELSTKRLELFQSRLFGVVLENQYGPTEATVCSAHHNCGLEESGKPPIGRPIANVRIYILDIRGKAVPIGVVGEIYIGGVGVARGYANQPHLTAERFQPDIFPRCLGDRMYRTGDLGRWRNDGNIDFVGRSDLQVKVRGYRIELEEIEARLAQHPCVAEALVVVREDQEDKNQLVAYYTRKECHDRTHDVQAPVSDVEMLRMHAAEMLPEYMVPTAYVQLQKLPLQANGKVDRKCLPDPEMSDYVTQIYEEPFGPLEIGLAAIWRDLLKVQRVGRRDNFFELGGHSLLAVRMASRIRKSLGVDLTINDLFLHPRFSSLSEVIGSMQFEDLEF
jgi:arthrofactin-type cyclic lipopeptide synthetase C